MVILQERVGTDCLYYASFAPGDQLGPPFTLAGGDHRLHEGYRLNPRLTQACKQRGYREDSLQPPEYPRAIADYTKAIKLDPTYADAYFDRGLDDLTLGNNRGAVADMTMDLQFLPGDADGLQYRGEAYNGLGEYQKAIADHLNPVGAPLPSCFPWRKVWVMMRAGSGPAPGMKRGAGAVW
ncbi:MAG TPA: tetratricopeptide repeat protein [Chloroflexota bacterium]|nr:tetratricopeptide repeat protein [Chloroflexota bacterium]